MLTFDGTFRLRLFLFSKGPGSHRLWLIYKKKKYWFKTEGILNEKYLVK